MIDHFYPPPVGFRHVYRCRHCCRLVHTAEARDDEGRELILRAHLALDCPLSTYYSYQDAEERE